MTAVKEAKNNFAVIESLFKSGAHFGYSRSRRHPSTKDYIFGAKNRTEIFDLEKTVALLEIAKDFVKSLAKDGKKILFIGGKSEAKDAIRKSAMALEMPYVAGRWLGGTFTNFTQIKKRVAKYEELVAQREKGELEKYTKKERLLIDRKIAKLERFFSGLVPMKEAPGAVFVVDSKHEHIAVEEAQVSKIPVISLSNSDCNIKSIDYPIVGNDSSVSSIAFFVEQIANAYKDGKMTK